jgi:hypothetical protein
LEGVRRRSLLKRLADRVRRFSMVILDLRGNIAQMNRASKRYEPVEYLSPVLLFMAQSRKGFSPDPYVRINELLLFLKGEVETHVIPGEHMGILRGPGARRISETINQYIRE